MKKLFVTISLTLFFLAPTFSMDNTIHFLNVNFPPLWNNEGPLKNKGIADRGEQYIRKDIKLFKYQTLSTNVARAEILLTQTSSKTYCAVPHGKGYFKDAIESKVWTAITGHVLTSRKSIIQKLKNDSKVTSKNKSLNLIPFFKKYTNLKGIIATKQRYPKVEEHFPKNTKQIVQAFNPDMLTLNKMVTSKRSDYTFQYESTVKYLMLNNFEADFITLSQLKDHYIDIVVGCNNTPLAKKFIK
jgi:uncharacterized protein (TIGR02285 family)